MNEQAKRIAGKAADTFANLTGTADKQAGKAVGKAREAVEYIQEGALEDASEYLTKLRDRADLQGRLGNMPNVPEKVRKLVRPRLSPRLTKLSSYATSAIRRNLAKLPVPGFKGSVVTEDPKEDVMSKKISSKKAKKVAKKTAKKAVQSATDKVAKNAKAAKGRKGKSAEAVELSKKKTKKIQKKAEKAALEFAEKGKKKKAAKAAKKVANKAVKKIVKKSAKNSESRASKKNAAKTAEKTAAKNAEKSAEKAKKTSIIETAVNKLNKAPATPKVLTAIPPISQPISPEKPSFSKTSSS